ncbi:MAG: hypothetical protein ACYS76_03480 [Planctomycetota bacterium]
MKANPNNWTTFLIVGLVALLGGVGSVVQAQQTVWIKFDDLPDGERVEDDYAQHGVHFVNDFVQGWYYRASPQIVSTASAKSPPNVLVNTCKGGEFYGSQYAPLVFWFDQPIAGVGMRLGCVTGCPYVSNGTVSLYDCGGTLRGQGQAVPTSDFTAALEVYDPTETTTMVVVDYGDSSTEEAIDDLAFMDGSGTCTDSQNPVVNITSHADNLLVATSPIILEGTVSDNSGAISSFKINGDSVKLTPDSNSGFKPEYTFYHQITLDSGSNPISAVAEDPAGNIGSASITLHYGPPETVELTEFHLTQRGIMRKKACDVDGPLVAGKFTLVRIHIDARTATGAPTFVSSVEMNMYRWYGMVPILVGTFMGEQYSPQVSWFDSPSQMAGIYFRIPGDQIEEPGLYSFSFQAFVGLDPVGPVLHPACTGATFKFEKTNPVRLFFCPTEAPMFAQDLGSKYLTQTLTALDFFERSFPIAHGDLHYVDGAPLIVPDGSQKMKDDWDYIKGTGFEWTFKDTDPCGLWRADHKKVEADLWLFGIKVLIGGKITTPPTLVNLPRRTKYGYFRGGDWPPAKYGIPMDDNRNGTIGDGTTGIHDDMINYISEFWDSQTQAWSQNFQDYEHGETFRSFVDLNTNLHCDKGEPVAPTVARWVNASKRLAFGPALQRMNEYNKSLISGPKRENAVLWFPEPFHPKNKAFGMWDSGRGDHGGRQSWVRIPPVYEAGTARNGEKPNGEAHVLAHEIGHNFGLGDTYGAGTSKSEYEIPAWAAYNRDKPVFLPRNIAIGIMRGANYLSELFFSDKHYKHLFDKLKASSSPVSASVTTASGEPAFWVSGTVDPGSQLLSVNTSVTPSDQFTEPDPESPYVLLLGRENTPLLEFPIPVAYTAPIDFFLYENEGFQAPGELDEELSASLGGFSVVVPFPADTNWAEIIDGNTVLLHIDRSPNAPSVEVVHPNGGQHFGPDDDVLIEWVSEDPDGDDLVHTVLYSPDYGMHWQVLASGLTAQSFLWNTGASSGGDEGLILVKASDGFNVGEDQSDGIISVEGKPPVAAIYEPQAGSEFLQWEHLTLRGGAIDGETQDPAITWRLNGEAVGASTTVRLDPLAPGQYVAQMEVQDGDGLSALVETEFKVLADSDADGMTNRFEQMYGLELSFAGDALWDLDEDGLSSFDEAWRKLNPNDPDTDDDDISDGDELVVGTDPNNPDTDGDGLIDGEDCDPLNPTGRVNFVHFAHFALQWLNHNCGEPNEFCQGQDRDQSGQVDFVDLKLLLDTWLTGVCDVVQIPPLLNDECVFSYPVAENVVYEGTTVGTSGTDISSCAFGDSNDVWHRYTATGDGVVTISLCGSSFDTTLAVYDACGGEELTCNDDSEDCGVGSLQSQSTLAVTADTTYYIRVAGYDGATGEYILGVAR